jgi:hypothetical protein
VGIDRYEGRGSGSESSAYLWRKMGRPWLLLSLALVGALGGCDLPHQTDGESEGLEALRAARAEADAARYLVAVDTGGFDREGNRLGQRLEFAPRVTRISQNGRVVGWERLAPGGAGRERDVLYSLRHGRSCYDRHSGEDFERSATIEMRRGIVVPQELIEEAELDESGDRTSIRLRGPISERGTRVEGRLYLDRAGRPVRKLERVAFVSRRPPRPWSERRYRYPARLDLGSPPTPVCETPPPAGPRSPPPLAGHPG